MANIRNSISLHDRMTPVFRSIIKSMDSTLRVMKNLDRQANNGVQSRAYNRAQRDIQRANNEIIRMQNNLKNADRAAGNLAGSSGKVAANVSRMGAGGLNLTNLAAGLYLLKNIASTMERIMEFPDTLGALQYRLDTYDTTEATGSELFDAAFVSAQRSRSELESTANLASRILVSGATGGSGAQSIALAEILNKASFLGGSSPGESQRALLQLSQALASGTLQGDELRAIREQAPGLTDTMARGLSSLAEKGDLPEVFLNTTVGALKGLGAEGELTAERVIAAFREMRGYVDEKFGDSPKQFGQAVTGISNVWKRWLKLMSQGDNGLAKINEKMWQLLDWLESADGQKFFANLASAVNFVIDGIITLIDWVASLISWFNNLESASSIVQSAIITLALVVAAAAAFMVIHWVAAWASAIWPVLVVAAILGVIIYALLQMGLTANQIVGGIAGAFVFLGYVLYDIIIVALLAIVEISIGLGMVLTLVIQGIVQVFWWAYTSIVAILTTIYNLIYSIIKGAWGAVKGALVGIYQLFVWLGQGVLAILGAIAQAIDFIFGSNLQGTIEGWSSSLGDSVDKLNDALDPLGEFEDIKGQWNVTYDELGDMYAGKGEFEYISDLTNFGETWDTFTGAMKGVWDYGTDKLVNPMDGWDVGYDFGSGLVDDIGNMDFNAGLADLTNIEDMMGDLALDGLTVNGGDLDSVGSIKSDVDISDQDIKLLRDMAARDFLLNLQTVTPQANISFGDVRETADVNKILEFLQDMVDEQLATSLVVD